MLDTQALKLDVAKVVRVARQSPFRVVRWPGVEVQVDQDTERLVLEDGLVIELERVPVRVPSTGRMVRGPILARCPRGCGNRARVLWLDPHEVEAEVFPMCRECARVEYFTARASELDRARIAYQRLRDRLGLSKYAGHEPRLHQNGARISETTGAWTKRDSE